MTTNVLRDNLTRAAFFSIAVLFAVFVGMLLLTTLHP
jgi:hypothetical protein